jgi:succinoglycan biosynthesis transport protein ExoP
METPSGPGLSDYLAALKRRRNLLLGVSLPIVALAAMLAVGLPSMYTSSGFIEIEEAQNLKQVVSEAASEPRYADQYVASLGSRVLSTTNLRKLLQEHRIYDDQDENPSAAIARLKKDINVDIVTMRILDPSTGREREVVSAFTVAFDHRDPERAHLGAQWLVDSYLQANRLDRQHQAETAAKFYAAEAERVRKEVADLEAKLADFKLKHAGTLPELAELNMDSMQRVELDLRNVESQLQALRRERVMLAAQLQQARSAAPEAANLRMLEAEYERKRIQYDASHPDMVALRRQIEMLKRGGSTSGMTLRQQLANERAVLAEVRQRYSEDHPDVRRILRNISTLEARIAAGETADRSLAADSPAAMQLQAQLNATDAQIGSLEARATQLRARMEDIEQRLAMTPQVEREYQTVTRDLASARAKYEELVQRRMDSELSEAAIAGGRADKFRVVQAPSVPNSPAKPKRIAIVIIGVVLAAMIGLAVTVVVEAMDQTVRGSRDVRDILGVSPLVAVPLISNTITAGAQRKRILKFGTCALVGVVAAYLVAIQVLV